MIKSEKKMKLENGIYINYELFDSLDEIVKTNRTRPHRHNDDRLTYTGYGSWDGARSYKEAEDMAIHGWKEQEDNDDFDKLFRVQDTQNEEKMISFKNDIVGFVPIIPLALQGVPTNMQNVIKKRVKSKIVHIVYNISTCCGTSSQDILEAGLKLFKVIMKLERQGYRVRLTAMQDFSYGNDNNSSDFMILNLKSEYKPLDVSSMMFPLMHPAMFRIIGFCWFERSPVSEQRSGYGRSFNNKKSMLEALNKILKTEQIRYIWYDEIERKDVKEIIEMLKL